MATLPAHSAPRYRREEGLGLGIAVVAHIALFAFLITQPPSESEIAMPERMTVNLTDDIGLESAAPIPVPESRASVAPTLSDTPPVPREVTRSVPEPSVQPRRVTPQPRQPDTPRSQPQPRQEREGGGSRIGSDFLAGSGGSTTTQESRPSGEISGRAQASLLQGITREIKPHWQPPSGVDIESLVSVVRFDLNPDGSLKGRPTVLRQTGITDANRAQAGRHGEQAIRAVQLAAPFDLPEEYYSAWKRVTLSFDWRLSQ